MSKLSQGTGREMIAKVHHCGDAVDSGILS